MLHTENMMSGRARTGTKLELNKLIDSINKKYGPQTIKSAACGITQPWKTIHDYKSQHYTTDWNDLKKVEL